MEQIRSISINISCRFDATYMIDEVCNQFSFSLLSFCMSKEIYFSSFFLFCVFFLSRLLLTHHQCSLRRFFLSFENHDLSFCVTYNLCFHISSFSFSSLRFSIDFFLLSAFRLSPFQSFPFFYDAANFYFHNMTHSFTRHRRFVINTSPVLFCVLFDLMLVVCRR